MSSEQRILVDLTTAFAWRGRKPVGIVRTEREIAIRLLRDGSLNTLPFVFHGGQLRALEHGFADRMLREADTIPSPGAPGTTAMESAGRPPRRLGALRTATASARAIARAGLRAVPAPAREDTRLALIHLRQAFRELAYTHTTKARPGAGVGLETSKRQPELAPEEPDFSLVLHPQPQDVMFTCGLGWDHLDWSPIAELKARTGLRVVCLCYDLIPILFRTWIPQDHDLYLSHFLSMVDVADEIPCISRATERDLISFAASEGRPRPSTHVLTLGADLPAKPDPAGIPDEILERLQRGRFALTVGTVEVRKNHSLLLDIWDDLVPSDSDFDLDLVVVGMRGWMAAETIRRLETSPLRGKRLHWLNNLPDAALSWLYQHSHVVLYPSLYEGWGLPVVEALLHRRPVIASNRGSVPEAGFGAATIIDPDDRASWRDAVLRAAHSAGDEAPPIIPPSWDNTVNALRRIIETAGTHASRAVA